MFNVRENLRRELPPPLEQEPEEEIDLEQSEPMAKKDVVSDRSRRAFSEMLRQIELEKNDISEDPQLAEELETMIETLPSQREKEVIRRRFFGKESLREIAKNFGVHGGSISFVRVREIEAKALRHLRHPERRKHVEGVEL